jgi:RNA polymerase sigma factor (sigma-70 family)
VIVASPVSSTAPVREVEELYARLGRRLENRVRAGVTAPPAVIEDACQLAWSHLICHRQRVDAEHALAWLATTATREAFRLWAREQREQSLEQELEERGDSALPRRVPGPHELLEARQRLVRILGVSDRQRRLLWLHAFGLDYDEMAGHEGCTRRTVERQLLRAKRTVREIGRGRSSV